MFCLTVPHTKSTQGETCKAMQTKRIVYPNETEPGTLQLLHLVQTDSANPVPETELKCGIWFRLRPFNTVLPPPDPTFPFKPKPSNPRRPKSGPPPSAKSCWLLAEQPSLVDPPTHLSTRIVLTAVRVRLRTATFSSDARLCTARSEGGTQLRTFQQHFRKEDL